MGGGKFLGLRVRVASSNSELPFSCGEPTLNQNRLGQRFLKIFFVLQNFLLCLHPFISSPILSLLQEEVPR